MRPTLFPQLLYNLSIIMAYEVVGLDTTNIISSMKHANTWAFSVFLGLKVTSIDHLVIGYVVTWYAKSGMWRTYLTVWSIQTMMVYARK